MRREQWQSQTSEPFRAMNKTAAAVQEWQRRTEKKTVKFRFSSSDLFSVILFQYQSLVAVFMKCCFQKLATRSRLTDVALSHSFFCFLLLWICTFTKVEQNRTTGSTGKTQIEATTYVLSTAAQNKQTDYAAMKTQKNLSGLSPTCKNVHVFRMTAQDTVPSYGCCRLLGLACQEMLGAALALSWTWWILDPGSSSEPCGAKRPSWWWYPAGGCRHMKV